MPRREQVEMPAAAVLVDGDLIVRRAARMAAGAQVKQVGIVGVTAQSLLNSGLGQRRPVLSDAA